MKNWLFAEFRGWSLAHFILDGAATGMITTVIAVVGKLEWWQTGLIAFFALLVFTSSIALWLRRGEGQEEERESRGPEKGNVRGLVKDRYRLRSEEARNIGQQEQAVAFVRALLCELEMHFTSKTVTEFKQLTENIHNRTDWRDVMQMVSVKLSALTDIIHYSDIRRLPMP